MFFREKKVVIRGKKRSTPSGNSGQGREAWRTVNLFLERIKGVCELEGRLQTIDPLYFRSMVQVPVHDGFNARSIKRGWCPSREKEDD
ncbi:hypothetical protein NPIL_476071 [Nephila pilipes]|uniref:Uncharacterized protein n=1 Tax=Nephila pilipes TaxID=299642 RepID=A0A8X6N6X1_NEPPI|nr:hypothetical protein NPIL_476071 [Nephila pilipes]